MFDKVTDDPAGQDQGVVVINSRRFYLFQFGAVTLLILLAAVRYVIGDLQGHEHFEQLTRVFDLDRENSIPTWFSMMNMLISGVLLFAIYTHGRKQGDPLTKYWLLLAILLLGMSAEEVIGIHERITYFHQVRGSGIRLISMNAWIVYGTVLAAVALLIFTPFLLRLDRRTALMFVMSGGVFLSGALVSEFLQTLLWDVHPSERAVREAVHEVRLKDLLLFLEEGCEMYGIALLNCILFARIQTYGITMSLRTVSSRAGAPESARRRLSQS